MSVIAGLQDFRQEGPPADTGTFQLSCSVLVFQHTFAGTTYICAVRSGVRGWVLVDYGTVAATVINSALAEGGETFVRAATYILTATLNISINNVTLMGEGRATLLQVANATQINAIRALSVTGVLIANVRIDGNKANNTDSGDAGIQHGIDLNTCTHSKISHVWVENCEHTGINVYEGDHNTVEYCHTLNNGETHVASGSGIDVHSCDHIVVTGNISRGNFVNGIWIDALSYATVVGNICELNTGSADPSGAIGIILNTVVYGTCAGNTCNSNGNHGIAIVTTSLHIAVVSNITNSNTSRGINVEASSYVTVGLCTASNNGLEGIFQNGGANCSYVGCTTFNNGQYAGIMLYDTTDNVVVGNNVKSETYTGIILNTVNNTVVNDNVVCSCVRNGIALQDVNFIVVSGNNIRHNDVNNTTTYDGIVIHDVSSYNLIISNIILDNDRYEIHIQPWGTVTATSVFHNTLTHPTVDHVAMIVDNSTTTIYPTIVLPFVDGTESVTTDGAPKGWLIDAATDFAIAYGVMPPECQQSVRIKVWAVGLAAPGAGNQMRIDLVANGAQPDEVYTGEAIAVSSKESNETAFAVNDIITWTFTATDDVDIGHLVAGDCLEIKMIYRAAVAPDIATNALLRCVEIQYV